jgi:hypothetical protein
MALQINAKKRPVVTAISILAIVASLTFIIMSQCSQTPEVNMKPFLAAGQVMAEETSKLIGNNGQVVVIILDTKKIKTPAIEAQVKTFADALKKQGGVTIKATEYVSIEALEMGGPEMGLPSNIYMKVITKYPDIAAIVSFVGTPNLSEQDLASLPEKIPKLVAFSAMPMGLKKLFDDRIIDIVIVPRFDLSPDGQKKLVTLRDYFDQQYKVITPENASTLPF